MGTTTPDVEAPLRDPVAVFDTVPVVDGAAQHHALVTGHSISAAAAVKTNPVECHHKNRAGDAAERHALEPHDDGGSGGHIALERRAHLGRGEEQAAYCEGFKVSNDPMFEEKVAEIVGPWRLTSAEASLPRFGVVTYPEGAKPILSCARLVRLRCGGVGNNAS